MGISAVGERVGTRREGGRWEKYPVHLDRHGPVGLDGARVAGGLGPGVADHVARRGRHGRVVQRHARADRAVR